VVIINIGYWRLVIDFKYTNFREAAKKVILLVARPLKSFFLVAFNSPS